MERRCVASEALLSADIAAGIGTPSCLAAASTALWCREHWTQVYNWDVGVRTVGCSRPVSRKNSAITGPHIWLGKRLNHFTGGDTPAPQACREEHDCGGTCQVEIM